jgi:hypothetical protein
MSRAENLKKEGDIRWLSKKVKFTNVPILAVDVKSQ